MLIDLRLTLRRLAHYVAATLDHRLSGSVSLTRTRALDETLKVLFTEGREAPDGTRFGGKGFRSTWQEGIVAAATPLVRQQDVPLDARPGAGYDGDLVAPMIRDVGLALAMGDTPLGVMAANLGKAGSIMNGGHDHCRRTRPAHWGMARGVLPPTAPLPIAACTMTGLAFAAVRQDLDRFHVACIGEGASSSGEFWEAMNPQVRAAYRSPTFFKTTKLPSTRHLRTNLASNLGRQGGGNGLPGLDDRRFRPGGHPRQRGRREGVWPRRRWADAHPRRDNAVWARPPPRRPVP